MSTAEVTIEQLLAGALALLALALPFVDPAWISQLEHAYVAGSLLGAAYLLGVVFDKIADVMAGGAEQWTRVRIAHERDGEYERSAEHPDDPFPQHALEANLRDSEGKTAWMSYLRTRIRLSRALGVFAPLIGLALTVWIARVMGDASAGAPSDASEWMAASVPAIVFVLSVAAAWFAPTLPKTPKWSYAGALPSAHRAPGPSWLRLGRLVPGSTSLDGAQWRAWTAIGWSPIVLLYTLAVFFGILPCLVPGKMQAAEAPIVIAIVVASTLLGVAALWSWYRIAASYMRFVADAGDGKRRPATERRSAAA